MFNNIGSLDTNPFILKVILFTLILFHVTLDEMNKSDKG